MSFERYCGMVSAATIFLILAFVSWTGIWGPVWTAAYEMKPGDALGVIVAVVGWLVTIAVAAVAYSIARNQIKLAQAQIDLQQQQIRETQAELAQTNFIRVNSEVDQLGEDIDQMLTAAGYLQRLADRFPSQDRLSGWTRALWDVRRVGDDVVSHSAASTPFGYGARVTTLVTRLQRMGDALFSEITAGSITFDGAVSVWDPHVRDAVTGISLLASQIRDDVPKKHALLGELARRRDLYADRAEALAHASSGR